MGAAGDASSAPDNRDNDTREKGARGRSKGNEKRVEDESQGGKANPRDARPYRKPEGTRVRAAQGRSDRRDELAKRRDGIESTLEGPEEEHDDDAKVSPTR